MNRLVETYPLTSAFLAAVSWVTAVVWLLEALR